MRIPAALACAFLAASACGPPRRPPGAPETEPSAEHQVEQGPDGSVLRFLQSGELILVLDRQNRVYAGRERLGRLDGRRLLDTSGAVVATMPEGTGPILSGDGGELPFVLLEDGTLLLEGQSEPARITDGGELLYPTLGEDLGVLVQGVDATNRRQAMLLVLFQSGFLSDRFRDSLLRAKAREVERNLRELARLLEERRAEGRDLPAVPLGPTPPVGCDARDWPVDADPMWSDLGFAPTRAVRFSYRLEPADDGFRLSAEGDLDCDGARSLYVMTVSYGEDGTLSAGAVVPDNPLE